MLIGGRLRVGLLAFVLVVSACSGTAATTDTAFPPWLETLVASTTEFQKEILSDGEVTIDELEKAVLATVQCMEENGVTVSDFSFDSESAEWGMAIVWGTDPPDDADLDSLDAVENMCATEYSIVVGSVFGFQNRPTPEEFSVELARTAQCMRDRGLEVPDGVTREQLQLIAESDERAYGECRQLAQDGSN
ncbi:hypothetical protein MNBD_ACTINO02-3068 [hydrothermal vent metagenome]|uniref:Lipoprotein n=1 Tax=hydrothermal vent metagenome TaxID=652676 RepID=A0A3B0T489_9ZZZZ